MTAWHNNRAVFIYVKVIKMSGRLTKDLRERMARCVLNNAFEVKQKEADKNLRLAGDKIHADIYGAHLKAMQSLPKDWLPMSWYIRIAIAGQNHEVYFSENRITGEKHNYYRPKLYVGDEPICIEYLKAIDARDEVNKQRKAMEREVNAILFSVQTFKKLWEVWPESKSLLEKFVSKPSVAMLPAIQFKSLNEKLGLPVGE